MCDLISIKQLHIYYQLTTFIYLSIRNTMHAYNGKNFPNWINRLNVRRSDLSIHNNQKVIKYDHLELILNLF